MVVFFMRKMFTYIYDFIKQLIKKRRVNINERLNTIIYYTIDNDIKEYYKIVKNDYKTNMKRKNKRYV